MSLLQYIKNPDTLTLTERALLEKIVQSVSKRLHKRENGAIYIRVNNQKRFATGLLDWEKCDRAVVESLYARGLLVMHCWPDQPHDNSSNVAEYTINTATLKKFDELTELRVQLALGTMSLEDGRFRE